MQVLKYLNPFSNEFPDTFRDFDLHLSFKEQLTTIALTALAALISLPILGLGGLAAFRALVKYYSFEPYHSGRMPDNPVGRTAAKTDDVSQRHIQPLTKNEFIANGLSILLSEDEETEEQDRCRLILNNLFDRFGSPRILLTTLRGPSKSERVQILELALKISGSINSPQEFSKLIKFVENIKQNREDEIETLSPFCKGASSFKDISVVKESIYKIPKGEQKEIQQAFAYLENNFDTVTEKIQCMQVIEKNIPKGSRVEFVNFHKNLLQRVKSVFLLSEIIQNIPKVTEKDIVNINELILIMNVEDDGTALALAFRCITDIPEEMRTRILDGISGCLHGIGGEDLAPVFQILKYISELEALDRESIVGFALAHIHERMNPLERRLILSAFVELDDESRVNLNDVQLQKMIELKMEMMNFFKDIKSEDRQEILSEINKLPLNQRGKILQSIRQIVPHIQTAGQLQNVLIYLQMIAPEYRDAAIKFVLDNRQQLENLSWSGLLGGCFHDGDIRLASQRYLASWLNEETDEAIATSIAQKIYDNINVFGLHLQDVENPLVRILFAILPLGDGHFDSPHQLFHKLIRMDLSPTSPVSMPNETIEGSCVKINQPHFESLVRGSKKLTFKELSDEVSFETLENLFNSFESRLDSLTQIKRIKTVSEGMGNCLVINGVGRQDTPSYQEVWRNYELLKNTFLMSEYVRNVLSSRGEDDQAATTEYLHAYAVIKFILEASDAINLSTGLSVQEEMLLHMLSSIQNCSTGKSEGFAEFYGNLPAQYRYGAAQSGSRKEKAIAYLHSAVQSILSSLLTDLGPMVKELINSNTDSQFVHTRKYLKNLIGKRVGLDWTIAFDLYPSCINSTLKNRTLENVLSIFYQYFTPKFFVNELLEKINREMAPDDGEFNFELYQQLIALFEYGIIPDESFEFIDEMCTNAVITEKGLVHALIRTGYLAEVDQAPLLNI